MPTDPSVCVRGSAADSAGHTRLRAGLCVVRAREVQTEQRADEISVYFRKLDNGSWFSLNPNETYNPASMIKVAYLITYMKMAESNPSILNKKVFFSKHFSQAINQNIKDFQLKEGVNYVVKNFSRSGYNASGSIRSKSS